MDALDRVIASHITLGRETMQPLDAYGDITIQHFIDLLSAAHHRSTLQLLVAQMSAFIRHCDIDLSTYQAVATPKLGNVLLGHGVAQELGMPSAIIRDSILFGKFVETTELSGGKMLIVDDVSSEAQILTQAIRSARDSGFYVDAVFTLVDRTEGDAIPALAARGVTLRAARQLSDADLANLVRQWKSLAVS